MAQPALIVLWEGMTSSSMAWGSLSISTTTTHAPLNHAAYFMIQLYLYPLWLVVLFLLVYGYFSRSACRIFLECQRSLSLKTYHHEAIQFLSCYLFPILHCILGSHCLRPVQCGFLGMPNYQSVLRRACSCVGLAGPAHGNRSYETQKHTV
jgi:hypothetical protein